MIIVQFVRLVTIYSYFMIFTYESRRKKRLNKLKDNWEDLSKSQSTKRVCTIKISFYAGTTTTTTATTATTTTNLLTTPNLRNILRTQR